MVARGEAYVVALGGHAWLLWGACMGALGCVWLLGGACVVLLGGMHGFIWGVCMVLFGGMHGFIRGCMVLFRGHAWFYSGGMCGFIQGCVCGFIQGGMHGFIWGGMHGFFSFFRYNEIRSMSRWYASYWNAFLLFYAFVFCC